MLTKTLTALIAIVALIASCRDRRPPVETCSDSLAGVWRPEESDHRYHIVDNGPGIEIYAMFDTTLPRQGDKASSSEIYAPMVWDLHRVKRPSADGLRGTRSQRVTRDGKICRLRLPAEISECGGNTITLRYERDRGVDWLRCKAKQTGKWETVVLRRE